MQGTELTRVLLIEDNPDDARFASRLLDRSEHAHAVTARTTLADGLAAIRESPFDVLLLDLLLPDSSPPHTFRRAQEAAPELPIVLLTGHDDGEMARAAIRRGAQDYLPKQQLGLELLTRTIRYAIERKQYERALSESERRYDLVLRATADGIWDWDLQANRVYYSPRWKALLGFSDPAIGDSPDEWLERIHSDDGPAIRRELDRHLQGETDRFEGEHRLRTAEGTFRWMLCRGLAERDANGRAVRMAGSLSDVHARRMAEEQLRHDALHDPLTGLYNRRVLLEHLNAAVQSGGRTNDRSVAVLFIDLDRFKHVNDSLGHRAGDELLQEAGRRLIRAVRPGDLVCRVSGDEFVVVLHDVGAPRAPERAADRIHRVLDAPFHVPGQRLSISASIGVAITGAHGHHKEGAEVLRDADRAMYRAKCSRQQRTVVFDPEIHRTTTEAVHLESELRNAVRHNQFELHYQPIVELGTGRLAGLEALVRWQHPERGLLHPEHFMPFAEHTGLVTEVDQCVLAEASRQADRWRRGLNGSAPKCVSVNFSAQHLDRADLTDRFQGALNESGLSPSAIRLELTEQSLANLEASVIRRLKGLTDRGVELHIDDFGKGYSSLDYLHQFPAHALKIDRSFVSRVDEADTLVRHMVDMGHELDMQVVAEGLETEAQLHAIRNLDCDYGQGYYLGRPLEPEQVTRHLERDPSWPN